MTSTSPPVSTRSITARVRSYVGDLWARREFAFRLAMGNFKARNATTALGLVWWVLNPLLLGGIYLLVFGFIFAGRRPDNFLGYLLSGIFAFYYTTGTMTASVGSILSNQKLLVNVRLPRLILPISALIESAAGFLVSIVLLLAIAGGLGQFEATPVLWVLPIVFVIHTVFNLGIGALVARLAVPFRDLNNLVPYFNRLWLYLSPIIWPLAVLDDAHELLQLVATKLNPIFPFLSLYRSGLLGAPLDPTHFVTASAWALLLFAVGVGSFVRFEGHMVRHI